MIIKGVNTLLAQLRSIVCNTPVQSTPVDVNTVLHIRESISKVALQTSKINSAVGNRLDALNETLFMEVPYQQFAGTAPVCQFFINPIVCGQLLEALEFAKSIANQTDCGICHLLHPDIQRVSDKLYKDGSYANAACDAFIEINSHLKEIYREKYPDSEDVPDGQKLMNRVFGEKNPVLVAGGMTTETGKDIQAGTRYMFAGAMAALRNPKSHENITLGREDCMRRLIFASMLMYIIDETVADSNVEDL